MWHMWGQEEVSTEVLWGDGGKKTLGRPKCKGEDNIKIGLQDMGSGMDQTDLVQGKDKRRIVLKALHKKRRSS
jgi:hypothetical protein